MSIRISIEFPFRFGHSTQVDKNFARVFMFLRLYELKQNLTHFFIYLFAFLELHDAEVGLKFLIFFIKENTNMEKKITGLENCLLCLKSVLLVI